jgi:hypothetical protein
MLKGPPNCTKSFIGPFHIKLITVKNSFSALIHIIGTYNRTSSYNFSIKKEMSEIFKMSVNVNFYLGRTKEANGPHAAPGPAV